ncbi:MAG: hypothetical protein AAGA66_12945 [Bacteroidota bacterium]
MKQQERNEFNATLEKIRVQSINQHTRHLRHTNAELVEILSKSIIHKIIERPTQNLQCADSDDVSVTNNWKLLNELFSLQSIKNYRKNK